MDNYDKLIKEMRRDLYFSIIGGVISIIIIINFITKNLFIIICLIIFFVVTFIKYAIKFYKFKNNVLSPIKNILSEELNQNIIEYAECIFTENYIINKQSYWLIRYDDILLMSKKLSMTGGALGHHPCTRLYLITKKEYYSFILYLSENNKCDYELSEKIYEYIRNKNPNMLIGVTKENKEILGRKYNIKLPKNWKSKAQNTE